MLGFMKVFNLAGYGRQRMFVSILCITLGASAGIWPASSFAVGPGDQAPAWQGHNLTDNAVIQFPAVLQNKPAVLVFWATWCPYCKAFMPFAKQIQSEYAEQGVQIITFNAKERGRGDPKAYVKSLDFPMLAIANADAIAELYHVNFIPGLMVVDDKGKVIYRRRSTNLPAGQKVSEQWAAEVRSALDELLR